MDDFGMDSMVRRVIARYVAAEEIPVRNKDTGRIVYVTRETFNKHRDKYEQPSHDELSRSHPTTRGKPRPPRKPHKPRRPEKPRDALPAPIAPPEPQKPPTPPKPVKPVKPVKPAKPPEAPKPQKYRKIRPKHIAERVAERWKQANGAPARS